MILGHDEIQHALDEHFSMVPERMLIELIELVLRDPIIVYQEIATHQYFLFYRLDNGRYLVAVVKKVNAGSFFATIYPTGKFIRNKHKKLKKVKI